MATHEEILRLYERGLDEFGTRVRLIGPEDWARPTPDTEWSVRDLVTHLVDEQLWAPPLLEGRTIEEIGTPYTGDPLGDDPLRAWAEAAEGARAAFAAPGALDRGVQLSFGPSTAVTYCRQMTGDLTIHAWDLARALGAEETIDEGLLAYVYEGTLPYADMLASSGLFAPRVDVPEDAGLLTRTLALFGRRR